MLPIIHFVYIFQRLKMITFFIPDWLDKTSNISILSCKLQTPALLPTHVTVGLPQMEGVAYSAICDATFMSRRVIRVRFRTKPLKSTVAIFFANFALFAVMFLHEEQNLHIP